jgi:prepilin-type N-terminal cleavage/methylation domain-containing protein
MKTPRNTEGGFTLLELLAAMAVLAVMIVMLFAAFSQASHAWLLGESRVETFGQARAALDFMAKELSQAIVTSNITFLADRRDLAFVAPVNQGTNAVDLMEVVYRLGIPSSSSANPDPGGFFTNAVNAWPKKLVRRTSHFGAPFNEGWDYGQGQVCLTPPWDFYGPTPNHNWPETSAFSRTAVLADNVMSISFQFFDAVGSLGQSYWNSDPTFPPAFWSHELALGIAAGTAGPAGIGGTPMMSNRAPAAVQITIGLIDGKAAVRLQGLGTLSAAFVNITNETVKYFSTLVAIPNRQQ